MNHFPSLLTFVSLALVGSTLLLASCEYQLPGIDPTLAEGGYGGMASSNSSGGFGGANVSSSSTETSTSTNSSASSSGTSSDLCGNGFGDSGEACDDANRRSGDGCDSNCFIEDHDGCGGPVLDLNMNDQVIISSSTVGAVDEVPRCGTAQNCSASDRPGPDLIYAVRPLVDGFLKAEMEAQFANHYMHIRTACPGIDTDEIACDFAYNTMEIDSSTIAVVANQILYVIADGHANDSGSFTLTLTMQ